MCALYVIHCLDKQNNKDNKNVFTIITSFSFILYLGYTKLREIEKEKSDK